jgi:hypothetical protein
LFCPLVKSIMESHGYCSVKIVRRLRIVRQCTFVVHATSITNTPKPPLLSHLRCRNFNPPGDPLSIMNLAAKAALARRQLVVSLPAGAGSPASAPTLTFATSATAPQHSSQQLVAVDGHARVPYRLQQQHGSLPASASPPSRANLPSHLSDDVAAIAAAAGLLLPTEAHEDGIVTHAMHAGHSARPPSYAEAGQASTCQAQHASLEDTARNSVLPEAGGGSGSLRPGFNALLDPGDRVLAGSLEHEENVEHATDAQAAMDATAVDHSNSSLDSMTIEHHLRSRRVPGSLAAPLLLSEWAAGGSLLSGRQGQVGSSARPRLSPTELQAQLMAQLQRWVAAEREC